MAARVSRLLQTGGQFGGGGLCLLSSHCTSVAFPWSIRVLPPVWVCVLAVAVILDNPHTPSGDPGERFHVDVQLD